MKPKLFLLFIITFIACSAILSNAKVSKEVPDHILSGFLDHARNDEDITVSEFEAALGLIQIGSVVDKKQEKRYLAEILNEYAKALFYGRFENSEPQLQKAFYFFKLASSYGNSESLYYLSFYSAYHLDGRYLLMKNYENLSKDDQHVYLKNYIKNMNATTLLTNAYISSMQGYNTSTFLMGIMYWDGKGPEANCPSAVLYFKELAELMLVKDEINEYYSPELLEKRRLDELYFHEEESDAELLYKDAPQELEYLIMTADLGKIPYINHIANTYYYGLRGEKRDLQKAFDYYYKAAGLGDSTAKYHVGKMLVEGIGVEKDITTGLQHLRDSSMRNNPKAKNALGKLYYTGELVEKDERKAIELFKEAAAANYTDGQYNYGVTLLKNDKEKEIGMNFINLAAMQGHTLAMFHLGLLHLEGTSRYYSCNVGGALLKASCERGPWSRKLREGYFAFTQKKHKLAAVYYMEAALLGYDIANTNVALLIDNYHLFNDEDLDVQGMKSKISKDPIWQALEKTSNYKPPSNTDELLFEEVLELFSTLKHPQAKKEELLNKLTSLFDKSGNNYKDFLMVENLLAGAEHYEPLSLMRLADLYQEGRIVPQNYTEAYELYNNMLQHLSGQLTMIILSHAYYNLAYMNHHGLGREKNLTKAITLYNKSLEMDNTNYYLVIMNKKLAEWELAYYGKHAEDSSTEKLTLTDIVKLNVEYFEEHYTKKILLGFLGLAAFVLYLVRLRLTNYIDIYLKEGSNS